MDFADAGNATTSTMSGLLSAIAGLSPGGSASSPWTWKSVVVPGLVAYVLLCNSLRFRRERRLRRKMGYPDRASLAGMTNEDAQKILQFVAEDQFPMVYKLSLQFAIFKTYGFETMSALMVRNKTFVDPATSPKRYEDTTCIFSEFSMNAPTSERATAAIARMNYLHSSFKAAGQISNADFLYTLSVCVTEPVRFMRLYEWRPLNEMEVNAIGSFWKTLGDAMDIEYKGYLRRAGEWRDGVEFAEDITEWAAQYERDAMRPAETNRAMGGELMRLLTYHVPGFLQPFVEEVLTVLMGDRLRDAFLYPEPGIFASMVGFTALSARRFLMRYLVPPRMVDFHYMTQDPVTGRIYHNDWLVKPYYVRPTWWFTWGPMALMMRALGGFVPSETKAADGKAYEDDMKPEGFLPEDLGPSYRQGKGRAEMKASQEKIREKRKSGCPFAPQIVE